ncbi:hypothetical protein [Desulfonema magnum]|uniref:Uncharacterized protein n=1 Tax=Desulfonema magnum TaxID=45655 RepID=A0A975GNF8_9BACT|nr:hypothetical protein [Desulfonema magnum]QTA86833.1 Uncharacterized protein dnm_028570 [Desulfonema magnum]
MSVIKFYTLIRCLLFSGYIVQEFEISYAESEADINEFSLPYRRRKSDLTKSMGAMKRKSGEAEQYCICSYNAF